MTEQNLLAYTVAKLIGPGLGVQLKSFDETFVKEPRHTPDMEATAREAFKRFSEQLKSSTPIINANG